MADAKTSKSRRNADLAAIHMGGKRTFGDVSKGGDGREAYEDFLYVHTGKRSAGKLTTRERIDLLRTMRRHGMLPDRAPGGPGRGVAGDDRPTSAQWAKLAALGRSLGWEKGLEDERLRGFVIRTAKVSSTRFLTRAGATQVITGLEQWAREQGIVWTGERDAVP
ncbi:MAG: regulatory protein GemA [Pseudomonadota bacterium]